MSENSDHHDSQSGPDPVLWHSESCGIHDYDGPNRGDPSCDCGAARNQPAYLEPVTRLKAGQSVLGFRLRGLIVVDQGDMPEGDMQLWLRQVVLCRIGPDGGEVAILRRRSVATTHPDGIPGAP